MVRIGKNLLASAFATSRSSLTCTYKCGNACADDAPNEFASNEYFGDVASQALSQRAYSRRAALKVTGASALALGGGAVLAACTSDNSAAGGASASGAAGSTAAAPKGDSPEGMRFAPVSPNKEDAVVVADGYEQNVLIRWGDPIHEGGPAFDFDKQTAANQKVQFGFNNDFAGLIKAADGTLLYVCSHEYTTEPMMFRGYKKEDATKEQVDIGLAAHGHTVLAVEEDSKGFLKPILSDKRNRRITGFTEFTVDGPAAGHDLLKTKADPTGMKIEGTLNNCSGGVTPWGTFLSGEENADQYFGNVGKLEDEEAVKHLKRYSVKNKEMSDRAWEKYYDRFDVSKEPNEPNRFFWLVEIDPSDPNSTPIKHTALGRFKHEAGQIYVTDDGTVVCYSGDDERFEYIYKFVSSRKIKEGDTKHNMGILSEGTLYVGKFAGNSESEIDGSGELPKDGKFDGSIEWVPLMTAKSDGKHESHVDGMSAEEVCIYSRLAGDKVGATRMDRPEDIEASPKTGKVYAALTNNKYRGKTGAKDDKGKERTDSAGRPLDKAIEVAPITENKNGLILEMEDDHAGTKGKWNLLLVCGDPNEAYSYFGGFDKSSVSPISCPDNLAFDEYGNMWISTDGNALKSNDGLFAVAVEGERRGETKCFLTVPKAAETCGPMIFGNRVMVNVQHPGEIETDQGHPVGDNPDPTTAPTSHWPDGGDSQPRPAVVQVVRTGGGKIGV
nr:PhoX family phosphatase [Corynebacterium lactis]